MSLALKEYGRGSVVTSADTGFIMSAGQRGEVLNLKNLSFP